ncbi:MAG TPA: hypothetical protein VMJ11_11435, partial [Paraburkholderia sp.]|nr:hypothetical protein [Paraburkholderia sp.]
VQYRPFQRMRELAREYLGDRQPSIAELKEAARRQGAIVQLDPQAAIEALPEIVPDMKTRRALLAAVYRIATVSGPLEGERRERYRHVQRALGVEPGGEKTGLPPGGGGESPERGSGASGAGGSTAGSGGAAQGVEASAPAIEPDAAPARAKASRARPTAAGEAATPVKAMRAARAGVKAKAAEAVEAKKAPVAAKTSARRSRAASATKPVPARAEGTTATRRRTTRGADE